MAEYISRETMINLLRRMADYAEANGFSYDREVIESVAATLAGIPAADVAQVVHGHWECGCQCSVCGDRHGPYNARHKPYYNYCPNCGAKMDEEE